MSIESVKVLLDCDDQGKPGELPAFAWPGAYTMFYVTPEGDELCAECATRALKSYLAGDEYTREGEVPDGYGAYGATNDYPVDYDARCDNCNAMICEGQEA